MGINSKGLETDKASKSNVKDLACKKINRILTLREGLPLLRGLFHFILALENPIQTFISLKRNDTLERKLICIVVHMSVQIHVTASCLLHVIKWPLPYVYYIRLFDHSGIFFYAAFGHSGLWHYILRDNMYCLLLISEAIFMMLGVFYTIFLGIHRLGRGLRCSLFLSFGLPLFPFLYNLYVNKIYKYIALTSLNMFIAIVSSMVYSTKLPVVIPNVIEYHEIFHFLAYLAYKIGLKLNNYFLSLD